MEGLPGVLGVAEGISLGSQDGFKAVDPNISSCPRGWGQARGPDSNWATATEVLVFLWRAIPEVLCEDPYGRDSVIDFRGLSAAR